MVASKDSCESHDHGDHAEKFGYKLVTFNKKGAAVARNPLIYLYARQDSNLRPSDP